MKNICIAIAIAVAALAIGCGSDSRYAPGPTATIENCLKRAGASIATESDDLSFASGQDYLATPDTFGLDESKTLSVGSYSVGGEHPWHLFFVVRKGYRIGFNPLVRHPEKNAKVVAYVYPPDAHDASAARRCL